MSWCHIVVKKVCDKITTLVYTHTIRKLLFLEPVHAYLSEVNPNPEPTPGSGGQNLDENVESEKEVEKSR
jgi:hypothetical protein